MDVVAVVTSLTSVLPDGVDEGAVSTRLVDVGRVRGWLDAVEAGLVHRLDRLRRTASSGAASPPSDAQGPADGAPGDGAAADAAAAASGVRGTEDEVAAAQRSSRAHAHRARRRGGILDELPDLSAALARGEATGEHVDAVSGALAGLPAAVRAQVVAEHGRQIAQWARCSDPVGLSAQVRALGDRLAADAGRSRRQRQRADVRLRMWTDRYTQMVHLSGRFDPVLGVRVQQRLDRCVELLFHERVPDDCPSDPGERQDFLRAHALAHLALRADAVGRRGDGRSAGGEVIAIIDAISLLEGEEHDETLIDVPGDIDPTEIGVDDVRRWVDAPDVRVVPAVLDANGVVTILGASIPTAVAFRRADGERRWQWDAPRLARSLGRPQRLDRARTMRVASRAQRVALRVMHARCDIPGCSVRFEHTSPHHVRWWDRDVGATDLANLGPLCHRHHHDVHDLGWELVLHADRHVEVRLPDGRRIAGLPPRAHHDELRRRRRAARGRATGAPDRGDRTTAPPGRLEDAA